MPEVEDWGKIGEGSEKVQTSSYKISHMGCSVYNTVTIVNNTVLHI